MAMIGLRAPEQLSPEEKVKQLEKAAADAEAHAELVKKANEYRRRIANAKLSEGKGGAAANRRNLIVFVIALAVVLLVMFKGC